MSEMTLPTVPLDRIRIGDRLRDLNEDQVAVLVESIALIGLLNPITVWAQPVVEDDLAVPQYRVVAGAHRVEACKRLGLVEIPAHIVDLPELQRQLAECDENLAGPTLTKAERALFTRRRKAVYEALHPETRQHVAGAHATNAALGHASAKLAPAFTADTAAKTGQSERAVQRDVTRGDRIAEDVLKVVQGTDLTSATTWTRWPSCRSSSSARWPSSSATRICFRPKSRSARPSDRPATSSRSKPRR
jgi:ParB family transcriptional regulator, chromosome partitioning protein